MMRRSAAPSHSSSSSSSSSSALVLSAFILMCIAAAASVQASTNVLVVPAANKPHHAHHVMSPIVPGNADIQTAIVGDGVVMLAFEPVFTSSDGTIAVYQAYISGDEDCAMDTVVSVQQSGCCKDAKGECQMWAHHSNLTCHGLKVGLKYRVNVIAKTGAHEHSRSVYKPAPIEVVAKDMIAESPDLIVNMNRSTFEHVVNDVADQMNQADMQHSQQAGRTTTASTTLLTAANQPSRSSKQTTASAIDWKFWIMVGGISIAAIVFLVLVAPSLMEVLQRTFGVDDDAERSSNLNDAPGYSPILDVRTDVDQH